MVTNYRPMSLLNADWKLLSSILTHHLNKALPLLLEPNQHGFTPHRQATEAILNLYATYNKMLQQSPQSALLSIDSKKAFDSVTNQCLLALLQCIGFPPKFQNLLVTLFHHGTARLYIDNRLSSPFKVSQGVCQGDPLSGSLFIRAMEPLLPAIPHITGMAAKLHITGMAAKLHITGPSIPHSLTFR